MQLRTKVKHDWSHQEGPQGKMLMKFAHVRIQVQPFVSFWWLTKLMRIGHQFHNRWNYPTCLRRWKRSRTWYKRVEQKPCPWKLLRPHPTHNLQCWRYPKYHNSQYQGCLMQQVPDQEIWVVLRIGPKLADWSYHRVLPFNNMCTSFVLSNYEQWSHTICHSSYNISIYHNLQGTLIIY